MRDTAAARTDHDPEPHNRLLLLLDPDVTRAWEKYESIRRRLVKFFEWNQCPGAEDLADEVLDRVAAKPGSEDIRDVAHYALGIARYVSLEVYKRMRREVHIDDTAGGLESLPDTHDQSREILERLDNQNRLACLSECLAKLMAGDRELVIQYYSAEEEKQKHHRQKIAEQAGLTLGTLRVRTNRLRERLEQCITYCLNSRRDLPRSAS
jgi:RNA polymerase sigma factor (sigma-70 family)